LQAKTPKFIKTRNYQWGDPRLQKIIPSSSVKKTPRIHKMHGKLPHVGRSKERAERRPGVWGFIAEGWGQTPAWLAQALRCPPIGMGETNFHHVIGSVSQGGAVTWNSGRQFVGTSITRQGTLKNRLLLKTKKKRLMTSNRPRKGVRFGGGNGCRNGDTGAKPRRIGVGQKRRQGKGHA